MEYLSRAAMAAKSSGGGGGVGEAEFLRELEEKIEVARLQLKILEAMQNLPSTNETNEAVGKLGADLIDISTLYGDYADRSRKKEGREECFIYFGYCYWR